MEPVNTKWWSRRGTIPRPEQTYPANLRAYSAVDDGESYSRRLYSRPWGRLVIANAAVLPPLTDALRPAVSAVVQNYLGQLCSSRTTGYSALARFLAQRLGRTELGVATYSFCPFFMW